MNARTWMSKCSRTAFGSLLTLAACLAGGCVLTESSVRPKEETPPTGPIHQVHADWESRIIVTQDVVNTGKPLKCLGGRLYLFGEQAGFPVAGDGMAIVEMCDANRRDPQGKPQLVERWEIDAVTFKRMLRKDMIGWGYSLLLPWNTYRPDLTQLQMQVRYVPAKGLPLFSPPAQVTLREEAQLTVHQRQYVPGAAPPNFAGVPQAPVAVSQP